MLRCIFSGALSPALNMGLDEALLRECGPPTLRLYRWSPPGLTLGYFQASAEFADVPGPHVLLRRLTGGGAIYHDRDITFALTTDAGLLPPSVPESYGLVHAAIGRALNTVGVPVDFDGCANAVERPRPDGPWCLAGDGPYDLMTPDGRKILGSAQRRIRRPRPRVLHHGAVALAPPAATPGHGSVADHAEVEETAGALAPAIAREIATALGLRPEEGDPTPEELRLARDLAVRRYQDASFTHRR